MKIHERNGDSLDLDRLNWKTWFKPVFLDLFGGFFLDLLEIFLSIAKYLWYRFFPLKVLLSLIWVEKLKVRVSSLNRAIVIFNYLLYSQLNRSFHNSIIISHILTQSIITGHSCHYRSYHCHHVFDYRLKDNFLLLWVLWGIFEVIHWFIPTIEWVSSWK